MLRKTQKENKKRETRDAREREIEDKINHNV